MPKPVSTVLVALFAASLTWAGPVAVHRDTARPSSRATSKTAVPVGAVSPALALVHPSPGRTLHGGEHLLIRWLAGKVDHVKVLWRRPSFDKKSPTTFIEKVLEQQGKLDGYVCLRLLKDTFPRERAYDVMQFDPYDPVAGKIEIVLLGSKNGKTVVRPSYPFELRFPAVTVVRPAAPARLTRGQSCTVEWSNVGPKADSAEIVLRKHQQIGLPAFSVVVPNTGRHTFRVPPTFAPVGRLSLGVGQRFDDGSWDGPSMGCIDVDLQ